MVVVLGNMKNWVRTETACRQFKTEQWHLLFIHFYNCFAWTIFDRDTTVVCDRDLYMNMISAIVNHIINYTIIFLQVRTDSISKLYVWKCY